MNKNTSSTTEKGTYQVDVYALNRLLIARGWVMGDLCRETNIGKPTIRRLLAGGPTRMSTLRTVAAELGVEPIDLIDASEYERPTDPRDANRNDESAGEWLIGRPLREVQIASNGL